jgi:glycine cleavage system H lipoate-binding protein/TusA-related sulfurtransferase
MDLDGCDLPEDRLYDVEESTWVLCPDGGAPWTLGLISTLVSFAGRVQSLTFRPEAGELARGRSVATVESIRYTGPVRIPVDGTVLERNEALLGRPKLLNDDPYGRGWVVRFRPRLPAPRPAHLESAAAVADRLRARIHALRIRCYPAAPDVELIEVGTECAATLARLDEELAGRAPEDVLLLVSDDPTSPIELIRWADRTGHTLLAHRTEGRLHHFLVRKEANPVPKRRSVASGRI